MTGPRNCRTRPAVVRPFQLALFTPSADCTLNVPLTAPENVTDASRLPGSGTLPPPDPDPVANWMRCCSLREAADAADHGELRAAVRPAVTDPRLRALRVGGERRSARHVALLEGVSERP